MLKFCPKCDSKMFDTSHGFKCKKCDNYNSEKKHVTRKTINSENEIFPYVKNEYYVQKEIRNRLRLGLMTGINLNKDSGMIVVFRNAHILKPHQTNIYRDRFDKESGIYHYVGKGLIGNQVMTAENEYLKNAKNDGREIHLFWQHNANSDHQYVGKVSVEGISTEKQPDKNNKIRDVFVFLLKPEN